MPKLSGSLGRSRRSIRIATVASSMAALTSSGTPRLDQELQADVPRAEHLLKRAERDDRELVLRVAEGRSLLLADADHAEMPPPILIGLVERIAGPNSCRRRPSRDRRPAGSQSTSVGLISRPRSTSKVEK